MIRVTVHVHQHQYSGFISVGHAGMGTYGKDVVCAGASALILGSVNTLTEVCDLQSEQMQVQWKSGSVSCVIHWNRLNAKQKIGVETVLRGMELNLHSLEAQYPQAVHVTRQEVSNDSD